MKKKCFICKATFSSESRYCLACREQISKDKKKIDALRKNLTLAERKEEKRKIAMVAEALAPIKEACVACGDVIEGQFFINQHKKKCR
jgi:hypothetical protein